MRRDVIKPALDEYAKTLDKTWAHDRSMTIGASEIGSCLRKLYWSKKVGKHADEDMPDYNGRPRGSSDYGALLRGTIMENHFWYPAMKKRYGKNLHFAGPRQRTIQDNTLSATTDGLVTNSPWALRLIGWKNLDACFLVECKTVDPRIDLREEKREHAFQVQQGMGLYHKLTKYKPELAIISYIDASFWNEVDEFVVPYDHSVFEVAERRAQTVFSAKRAEDLRPEGWIAGGKECEHCPYWKTCGVARRRIEERAGAENDPELVGEMTDKCRLASAKKKVMDEATTDYKSSQEDIKERLREKGVRKIPGVVNWFPVKGRMSYDMEGLLTEAKRRGVNTENYSQVGEPSDQLRILV